LVAFTSRHPPNSEQHALAFSAPCSAQSIAVARSKPLRDRIGHDDNALGRDGGPADDTGAGVTRYAEYEIGRLRGGTPNARRTRPRFDPMHLNDQVGTLKPRNQPSEWRHVKVATKHNVGTLAQCRHQPHHLLDKPSCPPRLLL